MKNVPKTRLDEFVGACYTTARHGLVRCSSGNLSQRIDKGRMLATSSRSWMSTITRDQVSVCRIRDGKRLAGPKQTVEIEFHAGILHARPDVNFVLHFQSPCATTLACRPRKNTNYFVIPEIPFYIGLVGHVPYLSPGTSELAHVIVEEARKRDLVVMGNHGLVTMGGNFEHALQNAEFFELACHIILHGGKSVKPIPKALAEELLALRKKPEKSSV